jgi:hypothetical protein
MNDWRDVVYAHLQAYREDVHRHQESARSGAEAQFLKKFGIPSVLQAHDIGTKTRCDALGEPPPKESFEVIEESAYRVLTQVHPDDRKPDILRIPYLTIRFLLVEDEATWRIAGVYHPCLSCNLRVNEKGTARNEPEKCLFCGGKGTNLVGKIQVRGFWVFKRRSFKTGPCTHCGGTGKCPKCTEEDTPGWRRVFSLGG